MTDKKKITITLIITILIGLLTIAGSFALWSVQLGNINVALQTDNITNYIEYTEGSAVFNDNLVASTDYTDGSSTIFNVMEKNNSPYRFYASINMKVNSISRNLSESTACKITITSKESESREDETIIYEGDFEQIGIDGEVNTTLLPSIDVTTTKMDYKIYFWIDETDPDAASLAGSTIDMEFWMEINQYRSSNYVFDSTPNPPDIVDGLIPVKLSDDGATVTTVLSSDPTWYDYKNKKWANAILVTNTSRSNYQGTTGVTVTQSDILAYYVWIPRYSYKVWQYTGASSTGQEREIEIQFITDNIIDEALGNGHWYTHPAFWWDDDSDGVRDSGEELSGIWVGKFETSHETLSSSTTANNLGTDSGTICNSTGCANYTGLRVLPNVQSLRYNRISNFFNASRFMESSGNPYGLLASSADSHMMKNSEWGAVAYLSHSKYGINEEVRINNQNTYTTGCGTNASGNASATCTNAYGTITTYPQSTTGNVTGVFDMSGGASEYVMGHYGTTTTYGSSSSGFSATYPLPDSKYYDNYDSTQFTGDYSTNFTLCTLGTCGGHALNETKSWYSDYADFVNSSNPWFHRGGFSSSGSYAGAFNANDSNGASGFYFSFRLVLLAE